MSNSNENWGPLGQRLRDHRDDGGDWVKNFDQMYATLPQNHRKSLDRDTPLTLLLVGLLLLSLTGNAFQFGQQRAVLPPPCPEVVAPHRASTGMISEVPPASEQGELMEQEAATAEPVLSSPVNTPAPAVRAPTITASSPHMTANSPEPVRQPDKIARPADWITETLTESSEDGPILQQVVGGGSDLHEKLLGAYRTTSDSLPERKKWPPKWTDTYAGSRFSISAGVRGAVGYPYRTGTGPQLTSYARLAYHIFDEGEGEPVGLELGFFQGNASWLNGDDILYRTEQPARLIMGDNFPRGEEPVTYDVSNVWGLELGLMEYSPLTPWLGLRTRLGLSYLRYEQRFRQISNAPTPVDFSDAPRLVQPFGMYWNVGPEFRLSDKLCFRLAYHGLIGNNARKQYFPGRRNGLEGVEAGLRWGF